MLLHPNWLAVQLMDTTGCSEQLQLENFSSHCAASGVGAAVVPDCNESRGSCRSARAAADPDCENAPPVLAIKFHNIKVQQSSVAKKSNTMQHGFLNCFE